MRRNRQQHQHHHYHQGSRRARSIWETRKENAPKTALLKAILYELQPVRFCTIQPAIANFLQLTSYFITKLIPQAFKTFFHFLCSRSIRQWLCLLGLVLYWQTVTYFHRLLDAGPIILIITALVIIFTVGLGDNSSPDDEGYISPYSVFNRGFQSILGSIDADNLLQQHVGGGAAAAAAAMAVNDDNDDRDGGNNAHQINRNVRRAAQGERGIPDANEGRDQDGEEEQQQDEHPNQNQNQNNNRSRKSGKKARRKRNLEQKRAQRREIELQREAAAALGFGGGHGDDVMAMNRLIEEQAELAQINNVREFDHHENDDI